MKKSLLFLLVLALAGCVNTSPKPEAVNQTLGSSNLNLPAKKTNTTNVTNITNLLTITNYVIVGTTPFYELQNNKDIPKAESGYFWLQLSETIIKLISAIAWPLVAIVVAFLFREEIAERIRQIRSAKFGSADFEFAEEVKSIEEESNIPAASDTEPISPTTVEDASKNPRGTILSSWLEVEALMNQLIEAKQLAVGYNKISKRPLTSIRLIQNAELLDSKYISLFHDLRVLRNQAAHSVDFAPPPDAVVGYVQLAKKLTTELKKRLNN